MNYDQAGVTRSVNSIQNELQYLASQGVLAPPQMQSIQAQLPVVPSCSIVIPSPNQV